MATQAKALALFALILASPARAAEPDAPPSPVDIAAVKDQLVLLHDGKLHYVAVIPFGSVHDHLYYGDGRTFYSMRVLSGGKAGRESWSRAFWEPRVNERWKASLDFRNDAYVVQCDDRKTTLTPVATAEQTKLLADARFLGPLWRRQAHALARDTAGTYYYVDRMCESEGSIDYRLFAGPRGNLKRQKMINVVADSQGEIFATKSGKLRLVLDKRESLWIAGKKETKLLSLPIDENAVMIYSQLGVYSGQRLGTPCDDL
jgi:hypothetical protein